MDVRHSTVRPMPRLLSLLPGAAALPLLALPAHAAPRVAEQVACRVDYGGETQILHAAPVASPYGVAPTAIGSYFLFRIVFEAQPASQAAVKLYTYADRDEGAVPIHQATFPYPPPRGGRYGFTGLQTVYEPVRDGELQYWCALERAGSRP